MIAARLPVSGIDVVLRPLSGHDEIMLADAKTYDMELALDLLARLTDMRTDSKVDWATIPVPDIQTVLLNLRRRQIGERIQTDVLCANAACGNRIDISFRVDEYIGHNRPKRPAGVGPDDEPGWYQICGKPASFRIPCPADVVAADKTDMPAKTLFNRCTRPDNLPQRLRGSIERAMDAIAPSLAQEMTGVCPDCKESVRLFFDPISFVLRELSQIARFIYEDIHLLAITYHWSEESILALSPQRRTRYAQMIDGRGGED